MRCCLHCHENRPSFFMGALAACDGRLSDDVLALTFDDVADSKATWSTRNVDGRQLARSVSHLLRTVTRIVDVQSELASLLTSREGAAAAAAWPLLLKLDNTRCRGRCFTSARSAAAFLAVYRARQLDSLNITSVAGKLSPTPLASHYTCVNAGREVQII